MAEPVTMGKTHSTTTCPRRLCPNRNLDTRTTKEIDCDKSVRHALMGVVEDTDIRR